MSVLCLYGFSQADFTVDLIAEYMWPPGDGDLFMVQEQISAFLGVKSFKRKYPNLQRRAVDHDERQYLLERRLVSESLCDLGEFIKNNVHDPILVLFMKTPPLFCFFETADII